MFPSRSSPHSSARGRFTSGDAKCRAVALALITCIGICTADHVRAQTTAPSGDTSGTDRNGQKIVFLVDASGSMLTIFPRVKQELRIAVNHLDPSQAFNIILFHGDVSDLAVMSKAGPLLANADNETTAGKFIDDQRSFGGNDPVPAIKLAFDQKSDLIYIMADELGNADALPSIIDLFRNLNPNKATKVNAIMLKTSENTALEHALQAITDDAGGTLKIIAEKDL
jgi:hypothetical protein